MSDDNKAIAMRKDEPMACLRAPALPTTFDADNGHQRTNDAVAQRNSSNDSALSARVEQEREIAV